MSIRHIKRNFCVICDTSWRSPSAYKRHRANAHDGDRDHGERMETPREDQKCKHCMEIFETVEKRDNHSRVYHVALPGDVLRARYRCVLCGDNNNIASFRQLVSHANAVHGSGPPRKPKKTKKTDITRATRMPCGTAVCRNDNKKRHMASCFLCTPGLKLTARRHFCGVDDCPSNGFSRVCSLDRHTLAKHTPK